MLDKDYIDQMRKEYDYFTYDIKFKKHAFIYPLFKKKGGGGEEKGVRPYSGYNSLLLHSELYKKH